MAALARSPCAPHRARRPYSSSRCSACDPAQQPTPQTSFQVESKPQAQPRSPVRHAGGPGGPSNAPGDPDPQPDGPGGLSFRIRYWILLLAEYGGVYGTAAVVIAALTRVDVFGGLHWDADDVCLGLLLMAPIFAFDALVGLPDWSARQEDAASLVRLFVDPALLADSPSSTASASAAPPSPPSHAAPLDEAASVAGAAEDTDTPTVIMAATAAAAAVAAASGSAAAGERTDGSATASTSACASSAGAADAAAQPSALWAAGQRLRMALELMQMSSVRNNPGARLSPLQDLAVIVVARTAEEMLYRAVVLTLFGRWLRDRLYEAGADDEALAAQWGWLLPGWAGGAGPGPGLDGPVAQAAQWAALGAGVTLGAAIFAAKAWQEATIARRLEQLMTLEREEANKAKRMQQLAGRHIPGAEMEAQRELQARVDAAKASLAAFIGTQGALVWALEGAREVYQVAAAGAAFLLTGNLAAPLAGSVATEALASAYQRLGLRRSLQRRAEVVAQRRLRREGRAEPRMQGAEKAHDR